MNKKEKEAFEDRFIGTEEFTKYIPPKEEEKELKGGGSAV